MQRWQKETTETIMPINTKQKMSVAIATLLALEVGMFQPTEAKINTDSIKNFFNKIKSGISKANKVLTTIQNESPTAANSSAFGAVVQGASQLEQRLQQGDPAVLQTLQQLQSQYQNLEQLRQLAQAAGASIQDRVNYLNAYNNFRISVTTALTNSDSIMQAKALEYNNAKAENDALKNLSANADKGYAASQSVNPSTTAAGGSAEGAANEASGTGGVAQQQPILQAQ